MKGLKKLAWNRKDKRDDDGKRIFNRKIFLKSHKNGGQEKRFWRVWKGAEVREGEIDTNGEIKEELNGLNLK